MDRYKVVDTRIALAQYYKFKLLKLGLVINVFRNVSINNSCSLLPNPIILNLTHQPKATSILLAQD